MCPSPSDPDIIDIPMIPKDLGDEGGDGKGDAAAAV